MIALWMAYAVVVGALMAVAARAGEEATRAWRLPVRWVWIVALALAIAVPVAGGARGAGWVPAVRSADVAGSGSAISTGDGGSPLGGLAITFAEAAGVDGWASGWPTRVTGRIGVDRLASLDAILSAAWAGATLLLLSVLAWTIRRAASVRSGWPRREVFGEPVRVAPGVGPAVQGVLRSEIILPEWLLSGPDPEARLAVAHEREHVRAGDPRLLLAGWLAVALFPWNPVVWWMYSRLRLAIEIDCDRRVLAAGVGRRAYGSMLVGIASRGSIGFAGAVGLIGASSHLERRIRAMTQKHRNARLRAGACGAIAVLALAAACDTEVPTAAEIEAMDLAMVEDRSSRLLGATAGDGEVAYVVDGVVVDRETAEALPPETIESIEVMRVGAVGRVEGQPRESRSISIRMRPDTVTVAAVEAASTEPDPVAPAPSNAPVSQPVIVIDGVPQDRRAAAEMALRAPRASAAPAPEPRAMLLRADTIRFRGSASTGEAGPEPLIIVDGVIVSRTLDMSSLDIQSIEVIKGPAAERIYGARGANGVISVETRAADPNPR